MMDRAIRAAKVEPALYEEVERDQNATNEAATIVAIAALASAIGASLLSNNLIGNFLITLISVLIGWVVWSYITYFVGTRLFNGTATPGELLRTIGYAHAPRVLGILGFIPILGWLISLAVAIWSLWAGIVAVRQALDFDTGKAVMTVVIGWIVNLVIGLILAAILAPIFILGGGAR